MTAPSASLATREVQVPVGGGAPRDRGAEREPGLADRQVLQVAVVPPVGVEHATAAVGGPDPVGVP